MTSDIANIIAGFSFAGFSYGSTMLAQTPEIPASVQSALQVGGTAGLILGLCVAIYYVWKAYQAALKANADLQDSVRKAQFEQNEKLIEALDNLGKKD